MAVKQVKVSPTIADRCTFVDVFNEVACLEELRFCPHICEVFDYGIVDSSYWIVMKYYPTTLKKWRDELPGTVGEHLAVLLGVFAQVLDAVHTLHARGVVHYDLKCENIILNPDEEISIHGDMGTSEAHVPVVALGDFGESRMMESEEDAYCTRNRGTEYLKSPHSCSFRRVGSGGTEGHVGR